MKQTFTPRQLAKRIERTGETIILGEVKTMDDLKNWLPVDTYDSIRVDEYNGKYSLQQGRRGDNDTYTAWCTPQKWSNGEKIPLKKNGEFVYVPWAISLGKDKVKAIKIAEAIVEQLRRL